MSTESWQIQESDEDGDGDEVDDEGQSRNLGAERKGSWDLSFEDVDDDSLRK